MDAGGAGEFWPSMCKLDWPATDRKGVRSESVLSNLLAKHWGEVLSVMEISFSLSLSLNF